MFKIISALTLSLMACMANASVLVNVPGIGNTSIGCSPQCSINSAIALSATYDPTQSLWPQVDNAGVADGSTIIFSQGTIAPTTDTATHIQWNGSGSAGLGFVIGVWDLSVPVPATGAGGMPGFAVTFGNTNITGPQIAQLSLPIGQITTSAAANSMTHYDAVIPALAITAGHNYGISIVAISPSWQWEIAANCSTSNYTGCIMNASTGLAPSTSSTMGGSIFHAAPVAFELTNDAGATPAPTSPVINTTSLPAATIGVTYSASISTTVPAGDATSITVSGLPAGLSFDPTNNTITGAASVIGSSNVSMTATDTTTKLSTSTQLTLTVNDIAVTFTPSNLPNATTNSAYTTSFSLATGGYGGFTYTASGLPAGLTLSGNTISGSPTTAGSNSITLTAVDSVGTATSTIITLSVIDPVAAPVACTGTNSVVTAYVMRNPGFITVNGGLNLLDHLWTTNLNAGNTTFNGGLVNWYTTGDIVSWTGTVDPSGCILTQLTVNPRVTITTSTLPTGVAGTAYSAPVSVTWGVVPYTTTIQGLPAGLTFNGINIIGTPTTSGTSTVTISTVDAAGVSAASSALTLTVSAPAITSFSATLPAATVGTTYTGSVSAIGGYGTLTYGATGLPAGLTLTGNTIAGTPTTAGTYSVVFTATDSLGTKASTSGSITVSNAPTNGPLCTKPATGATGGLNSKGTITAIAGNVITFKTKSGAIVIVTVPTCAKITWNGGAKAFAIGQAFEWNGYSSSATGNVAQSVTIN